MVNSMNQDFGRYLRALREEKKLSINQLAMYSKVSAALISRIENGQRSAPKPETLFKLSEALRVPYHELMDHAGYAPDQTIYSSNEKHSAGLIREDENNIVSVPIYEQKENDLLLLSRKPIDTMYLSRKWIGDQEHFGLVIKEPTFSEEGLIPGNIALIRKQHVIEPGYIAVCSVKGDTRLLKRIFYLDNMLLVQSNRLETPKLFKPDEVQILGQAVQILLKL